ncbi:MAG: type II CAAX prenyl endopeptidase Rce1 family protein [Anaerolineae bacterium]
MTTRNLYVRENWTQSANRMASEGALLWRIAVGAPVIAFVMALFVKALPLSATATAVLIQAVPLCFFYAVVVWYVLRFQPGGVRATLEICVASLSISVIAGYLVLGDPEVPFHSSRVSWIGIVGIALFPLNWLVLRNVAHDHAKEFEAVGLTLPASKWHWGYGILGGCLVAAHCFFTGFSAELLTPAWKPWPFVLWQLSLTLGLRSLSEELFFRGLIFNQLYWIRGGSFWVASAVAALGNALPHIVIGWSGDLLILMITLFYVAALAMVNALLYRASNSIAPGVVSSVAFHFLMSLRSFGA